MDENIKIINAENIQNNQGFGGHKCHQLRVECDGNPIIFINDVKVIFSIDSNDEMTVEVFGNKDLCYQGAIVLNDIPNWNVLLIN